MEVTPWRSRVVAVGAVTAVVVVLLAVGARRHGGLTSAAISEATAASTAQLSVEQREREPNDSPEHAQAVSAADGIVSGVLEPGDRDTFRVPVGAAAQLLTVMATGPANRSSRWFETTGQSS